MVSVVNKIVVPGKPAIEAGLAVLPFGQIHYHSTGNPNSSMQNEVDYLRNHWQGAYYTHLVGIDENGDAAAWQVAAVNGGAYDVGGDWNWEGYAAIEFVEGSIKTQEQFNRAYVVYIALGRQLAQEAGIPMTIDTPDNSGNKTHNYASATGHGSDHVDPIPFLAKWGVSRDKFNYDLVNGIEEQKEETKPTKKAGIKDMLLFKADVDTKFGSKANIYFLNGGIVIRIDSVSTYNELKNGGVPFATFTKKNTESLIDANGGLK